jgi:hypothetical protein
MALARKLKKAFGYDVRDVWRQVADEIGAGFDPGKERILQRPRISLELGGRRIVADIHSPGTSGVQDDETWLRTMLLDWQPFSFELRSRTFWDTARRLLGSKPPATGCPQLDRRFQASSAHPQRMVDLLSRPLICSLLSEHRNMDEFAIIDAEKQMEVGPPYPIYVLRYRELGHIRDGARLKRLFLLFAEALSALEGVGDYDPAALAASWGVDL